MIFAGLLYWYMLSRSAEPFHRQFRLSTFTSSLCEGVTRWWCMYDLVANLFRFFGETCFVIQWTEIKLRVNLFHNTKMQWFIFFQNEHDNHLETIFIPQHVCKWVHKKNSWSEILEMFWCPSVVWPGFFNDLQIFYRFVACFFLLWPFILHPIFSDNGLQNLYPWNSCKLCD